MFKTTLFPRLSRRFFNVFQKTTMTTTLFDDVVPPGVVNLRMGAPGNATLLRNAELIKNAAEKVMVSAEANESPLLGFSPYHKLNKAYLTKRLINLLWTIYTHIDCYRMYSANENVKSY